MSISEGLLYGDPSYGLKVWQSTNIWEEQQIKIAFITQRVKFREYLQPFSSVFGLLAHYLIT
jgi:hypothetical protein